MNEKNAFDRAAGMKIHIVVRSSEPVHEKTYCCAEMESAIKRGAVGLRRWNGGYTMTLEPSQMAISFCPFCCRKVSIYVDRT